MSLRVIVLGDSAAWGQGLAHGDKYASIFARQLSGGQLTTEDVYARSGAPIGRGRQGDDLDISDRVARHEVPYDFPTILQQVDRISSPETVDIAILNGGINDIRVDTILNPDTEFSELHTAAERYCYRDIKRLVQRTRQKCPNAMILVMGYYPILSNDSDTGAIAAGLGTLIGAMTFSPVLGWISGEIADEILDEIVANARVAHKSMLYWLRRAVMESAVDSDIRGPGVVFVASGFHKINSVLADDPYIFEPGASGNGSVARKRRRGCQRAKELGIIDSTGVAKCNVAASGHPNRAGARRYANRLLETYRHVTDRSIRRMTERLVGDGERLSLRFGIERYGLSASEGFRHTLTETTVDSLRLVVVEGENELEFGDKVTIESLNWGSIGTFDWDSVGNTHSFTVDPRHLLNPDAETTFLWDIDTIRVRRTQMLPPAFWTDWELQEFRLEVNGRTVVDETPNVTLHGEDLWSVTYPEATL